jgi:hypothetical protein
MAIIGDQLFFSDQSLEAVLSHRGGDGLRKAVELIADDEFANRTDEELVSHVVIKVSMTPLEIDDKQAVKVTPIKIDVTDRQNYGFKSDKRPIPTTGFRAIKTIPFKGYANLWHMKPNSGKKGELRGKLVAQALVIEVQVPESEKDRIEKDINEIIVKLRKCLDGQAAQLQPYNDNLPALALPLVQQRRAHLDQAADLQKKLQG